MNTDALREVTTIICHRHSKDRPCADGLASAILLKDAIELAGPGVHIKFASHGHEVDAIEPEPGAIFCDVTPSKHRAAAWVEQGAFVLDHHPTTRDVVEMFGDRGAFASHLHESGASLALKYVWMTRGKNWSTSRHERAIRFASLAAIRDTFAKTDPMWLEACEQAAALVFHNLRALHVNDPFGTGREQMAELMEIGKPLFAQRQARAASAWESAIRVASAKGTPLVIINTLDTSDVGDLAEQQDPSAIVFGFHYFAGANGEPTIRFSLRSGIYDVGQLCKTFGGGGHRAAAGFTAPMATGTPLKCILSIVDAYEQ